MNRRSSPKGLSKQSRIALLRVQIHLAKVINLYISYNWKWILKPIKFIHYGPKRILLLKVLWKKTFLIQEIISQRKGMHSKYLVMKHWRRKEVQFIKSCRRHDIKMNPNTKEWMILFWNHFLSRKLPSQNCLSWNWILLWRINLNNLVIVVQECQKKAISIYQKKHPRDMLKRSSK